HLLKTKMPCPADAAEKVAARTRELFAAQPEARFDDSDGLRIDLADSWVSVRASNTEPIMRIFAEAPTADAAESLVAKVKQIADEIIEK
ncbi:MAG: phosphoglucosamine mutase, partial [Phycisphaerae bacterium]|nr:phosphoglucosamine mutase [Phycisphaerae bacterium]